MRAIAGITTVSNVLNRPQRVGVESRNRVLAAIDKLGFVPRSEAISRARRKLGRIGVVAPFTCCPAERLLLDRMREPEAPTRSVEFAIRLAERRTTAHIAVHTPT